MNAIFFACELWVKRVGTFGVVLYHNQRTVNFTLHFVILHIGSSIRYNIILFENYFLKCYIAKRISILLNCFSEYIIQSEKSVVDNAEKIKPRGWRGEGCNLKDIFVQISGQTFQTDQIYKLKP